MKYILDSNVFIAAKNQYYGFDICPGFWDWLATSECVGTVDMVKEELLKGKDELSEWIKCSNDNFFIEDSVTIQNSIRNVTDHVLKLNNFKDDAKITFLQGADPWIIAAAKELRLVIVTHEKFEPNSKRIKIPNVAQHFGIICKNTYEMLRQEQVKFQ